MHMMNYYVVIKMILMECLMTWENVNDIILSKNALTKYHLPYYMRHVKIALKIKEYSKIWMIIALGWWNDE